MAPAKIYIIGASCSGVSTLASALSGILSVPHIDVDDYYWLATDPPFCNKRPPEERVALISERQRQSAGWILAGSFLGWGEALISNVDLIVFLYTPASIRERRLHQREFARYGHRILRGGDMYAAHCAFREWALRYDDPDFTGRSLRAHEDWLARQVAPVLRLGGERPVAELAASVVDAWSRVAAPAN